VARWMYVDTVGGPSYRRGRWGRNVLILAGGRGRCVPGKRGKHRLIGRKMGRGVHS